MALPWFGVPEAPAGAVTPARGELAEDTLTIGAVSPTYNAWESFGGIDIVLFAAALCGAAFAIALWGGRDGIAAPLRLVAAGLASLSALLIFFRLIDPPSALSARPAVLAGLVASLALVAATALPQRAPPLEPTSRRPRRPIAPRPRRAAPRRRLPSINELDADGLRALGLSSTQARRIVAKREERGGFTTLDELDDVRGLPDPLRERLRHSVRV